jgi:hypothetical protein
VPDAFHREVAVDGDARAGAAVVVSVAHPDQEVFAARHDTGDGLTGEVDGRERGPRKSVRVSTRPRSAARSVLAAR